MANSVFETYLKLIGFDIELAGTQLKYVQSLTPEQFHKWQDEQKWKIARYHFENNPFYRRKVGERFPRRWEDLPIMVKTDFQDKLEALLSKGYNRKNTYFANTSGSSGHPFFFAKNKEAHAMDWALIMNRYKSHGLNINSKQARFYGIPLEKTGYIKERIKDWIMNRVRFPVFDMSDENLKKYIKCFKQNKFLIIYGYTNSLVLFARFLLRKGIVLKTICPTLTHCITTSEVLTIEDRNILNNTFDIPVINEYGASETGLIAFESPDREWLLCEEILNYEILDDNGSVIDGTGGNIIVTDLDNKAMPFIRYKIGDIGIISKNVYGLNRKLEKLLGRENDTLRLPSGRKSPGLTFYYISRSILEVSEVLKEFIIRQTKINEFVFDVVADRDLTNVEITDIQTKMDIYLEPGLNLKINRVSSIERPPSGKIKHFYSEITCRSDY